MRRWLVIAGLALVGLCLCGFSSVILFYPQLGSWVVRTRVLPRLEAKLGRPVSAGHIRVDRGTAVIEDLQVAGAHPGEEPLVSVAHLEADFDFWGSLKGDVHLSHATVRDVRINARRRVDGTDDLRDLGDRLGLSTPATPDSPDQARPASSTLGRLRPELLEVRDVSLEFVDEVAGLVLSVADMDTALPRSGDIEILVADAAGRTTFGPSARAEQLRIETQLDDLVGAARVHVVGGQLAVRSNISLSNIAGSIARADTPSSLVLSLQGSYGGADEVLWQASGVLDPVARTGAMHIEAERFALGRLASVLEGSALVDFSDTTVGARMDLESRAGVITFSGGFEVADANLYHPLVAEKVVRDIDVDGDISGRVDMVARKVDIERAIARARGVEYRLSGALALPDGVEPDTGERRQDPRLSAHLTIPPVPCQTMLDGFPEELAPYLQEFQLYGEFEAEIQLAIDWADLQATELESSVGIDGCRVASEPEGENGIDRLLEESFTHYVEVERDQWLGFIVGPENPDYVPLPDVSIHLLNAFMTTEDSRFYDHDGFIVREFKSALIKNLEAGYFRYGASSITMQTVKNVILYREKTLARKLQELFFTWHIENRLDKDRIFEIYVNAIEFGPGIYGIGTAARHYFGKHPRDLNPVEAAFFSSILPSPKKRYQQYCEDRLWRKTSNKIERILGLMHRRGRLSPEEYELAKITPLVFDRTEAPSERACRRMVKEAIANSRPTNPLKK